MRGFIEQIYSGLEGWASIWWRRTPGPTAVDAQEWFHLPEQLDDLIEFTEKNADKDVYLPIGTFTEKRRSADTAHQSNVVYQDTDLMDWTKYRVEPTWTVQTSAGRTHNWWLLDQTHASSEVAEVSRIMTVAHREDGTDPSSWSANKLLRIPGSVNTAHGGFPEDVKIINETGSIYSLDEIRSAYSDIQIAPPVRAAEEVEVRQPDDLPEYGPLLDRLSKDTLELAMQQPGEKVDRSRLRYLLLLELFREGLNAQEVASVAWHAPASRKWSAEDPRGIQGLYMEIAKAQTEFGEVRDSDQDEEEEPEGEQLDSSSFVPLLSEDERKLVETLDSFPKRYVSLAGQRYSHQNEPYDRINAWIVLSMAFSTLGFIPRSNGGEGLNLYTMTLGDTTTGKSQSRKFMLACMTELGGGDASYDIGGNASPSALGRKLLERDGKVSFFNKDEAHGALKQWFSGGKDHWTNGLVEDLAELYDGRVPPQLRTGNWDSSGKGARTHFLMHLMGTPDHMIAALPREAFNSGFLARFQWAIGKPRQITKDSLEEKDSEGTDGILGFDPMARQMASGLRAIISQLREDNPGMDRIPVRISQDAATRLTEAKWTMANAYKSDRNHDIIEPSLVRMGVTIRKCASLLALSEGRTVAELNDVLRALEAAEEWVRNLLSITNKVSASDFQRACDDVERYIASRKDGVARRSDVKRRFRHLEDYLVERYMTALVNQSRIAEWRDRKTKVEYVEIKGKRRNQ